MDMYRCLSLLVRLNLTDEGPGDSLVMTNRTRADPTWDKFVFFPFSLLFCGWTMPSLLNSYQSRPARPCLLERDWFVVKSGLSPVCLLRCSHFSPDRSRFISPGGFVSADDRLALSTACMALCHSNQNCYTQNETLTIFFVLRVLGCLYMPMFVGHMFDCWTH